MFNSYIDFVLYNIVGFLVGLLVWNWLPKPKPYDYTTIPGHKLDMTSDELPSIAPEPGTLVTTLSSVEGNMANIRKHQSFRAFLRTLHLNFGPLASFYWGPRYVISVNNLQTLQQLHSFEDNLLAIPAFAISHILVGEKCCWSQQRWKLMTQRVTSETLDSDENEEIRSTQGKKISLSRRLQSLIGKTGGEDAAATVQELMEQMSEQQQERALIAGPFGHDNKMSLLFDRLESLISTDDANDILCKLTSIVAEQEAQQQKGPGQNQKSVSHLLTTLKRPLVIAFDKEIDIDGHPIPANIPILLCMEDITENFLSAAAQYDENKKKKSIKEYFGWIPGLIVA